MINEIKELRKQGKKVELECIAEVGVVCNGVYKAIDDYHLSNEPLIVDQINFLDDITLTNGELIIKEELKYFKIKEDNQMNSLEEVLIKEKILSAFDNKTPMRYLGNPIVNVTNDYINTKNGLRLPFKAIVEENLEFGHQELNKECSDILMTLEDHQSIFKDGVEYQALNINGYPFFDVTLIDNKGKTLTVDYNDLDKFTLNPSELINVTINPNKLTFKDIVYLALKAEEDCLLDNTIRYYFEMTYRVPNGDIAYCEVNHNEEEDYVEAYNFIQEASKLFSIKQESDINKLREFEFKSLDDKYDTDKIKELLDSNIRISLLLDILYGVRVEIIKK